MTREEKVHEIAEQMQELVCQQPVEVYLAPDAQHTVLIRGRLDFLPLAEWVLARIG